MTPEENVNFKQNNKKMKVNLQDGCRIIKGLFVTVI